jgi:hypothetical protein
LGATGIAGFQGIPGPNQTQGYLGAQGPKGQSGQVLAAADIYAIMGTTGPDNTTTIAVGGVIQFPTSGPIVGTGITYSSPDALTLDAGVYNVSFVVSVSESAQLALDLDGSVVYRTVSGRSLGTCQVTGFASITTVNPSSTLRLVNVSAGAITITANAGGANPVSAHLLVTRVA